MCLDGRVGGGGRGEFPDWEDVDRRCHLLR
jgi:hypothetical protein